MLQMDAAGAIMPDGGQGVVIDPHHVRDQCRMFERAIKNEWPISPDVRKEIMDEMYLLATLGNEERTKVAAAKVLVAADQVNVKREAAATSANGASGAKGGVTFNTQVNVNGQPVESVSIVEEMSGLLKRLEEQRRSRVVEARMEAALQEPQAELEKTTP